VLRRLVPLFGLVYASSGSRCAIPPRMSAHCSGRFDRRGGSTGQTMPASPPTAPSTPLVNRIYHMQETADLQAAQAVPEPGAPPRIESCAPPHPCDAKFPYLSSAQRCHWEAASKARSVRVCSE
jgi:hypothetical protein